MRYGVLKLKKCKLANYTFQIISRWKLDANACIIRFPDFLGIECCQNYQNRLKFQKVTTKFLCYSREILGRVEVLNLTN